MAQITSKSRTNMYREFFHSKTIQKTDKFVVTLLDFIPTFTGEGVTEKKRRWDAMNRQSGPKPNIKEYHILNIIVPTFEFKPEFTFETNIPTVTSVLNHQGFEVTIMFEDDSYGTITRFVNWCQKRIMSEDGLYNPHYLTKVGHLVVDCVNEQDVIVYRYEFRNMFFIKSTPVTWDYSSSLAQKVSITLASDSQIFYTNDNLRSDNPT